MRNNKLKIVLDTNIFINAFIYPKAHSYSIEAIGKSLTLASMDKAELVFSRDTIGELMYVMKYQSKHNIKTDEDRLSILTTIAELFLCS